MYSFKIRGAYNKLAQLSPEELERGVVTASAGNHAQGLALAAKQLGIKATIVMPRTTPELKVQGVRARGGKVVLHGDAFPRRWPTRSSWWKRRATPISTPMTTRW